MPLTRYQSRNEYGLADPDLYLAADKDDPEALLEGVAMAGLVGILRQLGDLAEFAAEMFHDLHEEVMATASRSHGLMARVQQLESEFPFIEKAMLCQTDHSPFFSNKGVEWHPNLQLEQSVVTRGDLPRCVMDSYEECRGPPRLFLLDKFDISGAGACLKRYTDPSFVRHETTSYEASWDNVQREKKSQKAKRRSSHWRNGGTPENAISSHAKLHELFLEEHLETRHSDSARAVKLKTRKLDGYSLISKSGESYMERFVQTSVDNKTGYQIITPNPELSTRNMDSDRNLVTDIPEIGMVSSTHEVEENVANGNLNGYVIEKDIETVPESTHSEVSSTTVRKDSQTKPGFLQDRTYSEDLTSEADNYVDASATMESETETDDECRRKNTLGEQDPAQFSFFRSSGNTLVSENGRSSFGKRSVSYSYSDTASVSVDDQSDGERRLPSTSSVKSEQVDSTSHVTTEANTVSCGFNVVESVSSSNVDGQTSLISNDTCSSPMPVSQNDESCSPTVQSLAPEVDETSPELVGLDLVDSSKSSARFDVKNSNVQSETSSISSTYEGSRYDTTTIEKNYTVDDSSNLVNSGTSPQAFDDRLTGKELSVTDNDVETNSSVASSKGLANSGTPVSSADIPSEVCSASTNVNDTQENETDFVTGANGVTDVDSRNSVTNDDSQSSFDEMADEHSTAFGTTGHVSVSESPDDTLENGMSMPAEVDSKLTSDLISEREKSVGDASPSHSKSDEQVSAKDFHDLPGLDNAVSDIVPEVELAVSDNDAENSDEDVNLTSTKGSLPWISTPRSSSKALEICNDTVVESDETLPAENTQESEITVQKSPLETSSEHLTTASCESTSPTPCLDETDRDTETKSSSQTILVDDSIHSSPVTNNMLASEAIEPTVREQTPCEGHAVADEKITQSNVFEGFEFAPQTVELECNSPNLDHTFPSFGLIPESTAPNQEDMPPLPPLPPMQWLIGKSPLSFPTFTEEISSPSSSVAPPVVSSVNAQTGFNPSDISVSLGIEKSEQLPEEFASNASEKPLLSYGSELPTMPNQGCIEEFGSEENNLSAEHAAQNHSQESSSLQLPQDLSTKYEDFKDDTDANASQSSSDDHHRTETEVLTPPTQSTEVEDKDLSVPDASNAETAETSNGSVQKIMPVGHAMWPVSAFSVAPTLDAANKQEVVPTVRLPRPRSPLVDAVAAHDRRTMKKVSEMVQPPIKSKQDDNDSLLAQIRNKSVNLKPAAATRPSIQTGPKTNLRVAAILEKANTIRMAMAGSDEDEDSDSWSDS